MGRESNLDLSGTEGLSIATALAATSCGLQRTILSLAEGHGGKAGPWLDELEEELARDTKNIVFEGVSIEDEMVAVEFALENLKRTVGAVRRQLG